MFIPSAKSLTSMLVLCIIAIGLFIWVENSRVMVKERYHDEKLEAAKTMEEAIESIRDYRLAQGIFVDERNDPHRTTLIGERETLITTDRGSLVAKLTSLNPNYAAVIVDYFKEAGLKEGDLVAVSGTGSFPAINIAVMSAAKVMELDLVMIYSVGASMFGATDPEFTWLDMETFLYEQEIFPYKSIAASIGGGQDLGRGLSMVGRELIIEAIERNEVELVAENTLTENIIRKKELWEQASADRSYKMYVNVGGGLSSLGHSITGRLIRPGYHRYISMRNVPLKGTMMLFAEQRVPILHLLDISAIAEKYDLPLAPDPLPAPGVGSMYISERYNMTITWISLAIMVILIATVIFFDHNKLRLKEEEINI
jgi:poly-gamma-glutamate system protein